MTDRKTILDRLKLQTGMDYSSAPSVHIGIFSEPCLSRILGGGKSIESRFTKSRIAPYDRIHSGDPVLVKRSSGKVEAMFTAGSVFQYTLSEISLSEIRKNFGSELCVDPSFWEEKKDSRYAVLIEIINLVRLEPFSIEKKGMQTWIVL